MLGGPAAAGAPMEVTLKRWREADTMARKEEKKGGGHSSECAGQKFRATLL